MFEPSKLRLTLLDAPRELVEDFASSLRPMFPRKIRSHGANEDGVHVIEVKREGLWCKLLHYHLRPAQRTDGSRSTRVRAEPVPSVHVALLRQCGVQARREHTAWAQASDVLGPAQGGVDLPQYADAQTGEQAEAIAAPRACRLYYRATCTAPTLRGVIHIGYMDRWRSEPC